MFGVFKLNIVYQYVLDYVVASGRKHIAQSNIICTFKEIFNWFVLVQKSSN